MKNKSIYFYNNGNFDVEQAMVFGVSAKENENAIGHFGTGFKYAVAIILRHDGKIKVETEDGIWEFTKEPVTFRGETFDYVMINGERAGFTTRLGISWAPWQAYRELRCNATDEHGDVTYIESEADEFETVITVDCPELTKAHEDRDLHFVSGKLIGVFDGVEVYDKPSSSIFYQGVEVLTLEHDSKFSYNIVGRSIDLTEDRTAKCAYIVKYHIQRCMQLSDSEIHINEILEQEGDFYEKTIGFDKDYATSSVFISQAIKKSNTGKGVSDEVNGIIQRHVDRHGEWDEFELTKIQQIQYDKAVEFLLLINVNVNDYPVKFVKGMGAGTMGRAHKGNIYISEIPFDFGTKQLASTLLEEWVHLHTGAHDFDRTMQSWLFDKILSITEEFNGQPV